jgi:cytochrome c oxidase assembly protein subunit 15
VRAPTISPRTYRLITLSALIALVVIIVTGGAVRLTGSGLGCTNWPTCEGDRLVAPLEFHPMIEFVNRTFTGLVSLAVIVAVLGSFLRVPRRRDLTWLSLGLVAGVIGQIVLGGITVKVGLAPAFVTGHFLLSVVLVWNAYVLHHRAGQGSGPAVALVAPGERNLGRALVAVVTSVLVSGTMVTGAGPHAGDETAPRYFFSISEAARVHGVFMWCFLALAVVTLWRLHRAGAPAQLDQAARVLVLAIVAQGAIGYAQYFGGVPIGLVFLHILGSALVFLATLRLYLSMYTRPVEAAADPVPGTGIRGADPAAGEPTDDAAIPPVGTAGFRFAAE